MNHSSTTQISCSNSNVKNPFSYQNYDLYQFKGEKIIALVKKNSQQIEYIIWKNNAEEKAKVFNGFEAWKYKAMWNSQNKDQLFIRSLLLTQKENQDRIYNILKKHNSQKIKKAKNKIPVLNENISDGEFTYTNEKWEKFTVWILWWKIMNIWYKGGKISWAQKAAISRAVKNYGTEKQSSRLMKNDSIQSDFSHYIDQNLAPLWNEKSEAEIHNRFVDLAWSDENHISENQLYNMLNIYKYYAQYANTDINQQKDFLQNNRYIELLFIGICHNLKKQLWEKAEFHITRIQYIKKFFINYNTQRDQNY